MTAQARAFFALSSGLFAVGESRREVPFWAFRAMLQLSVADEVLSALEALTRTDEVRRNLDLELFELDLLDSLGVVELLVRLSDRLSIVLAPSEFDRDEWATPRKIIALLETRRGP